MAVFYDLVREAGHAPAGDARLRGPERGLREGAADIADGADVATVLDTAVDEIDADIKNNQGYGHQSAGLASRAQAAQLSDT